MIWILMIALPIIVYLALDQLLTFIWRNDNE